MPPRPRTKQGRTSGTLVSLTPLNPATLAPVESDVRSALAPANAFEEWTFRRLCEYDSDGARIREKRSAATPALIESLRYVSRDWYPTEDMCWMEDGNMAIIHSLVKCTGLRVPARPPTPLKAEEENDFLKMFLQTTTVHVLLLVAVCGFIPQFTRSSLIRAGLPVRFAWRSANAVGDSVLQRPLPSETGGQLGSVLDSFLPRYSCKKYLAKDTVVAIILGNNCRIKRQPRPSTRYARGLDLSANGLRRLPMATWPIPGEFYRDYIAVWIGPILKFALAHVRHINAWIIAQYGMTRV
jgi:hypothetical protein